MITANNFIFDLGGVLIDIDFEKVKQSFEKIGVQQFNHQYSQLSASKLFQNLETGLITETEFYNAINTQVSHEISHEQIKEAWNSILEKFRIKSLSFLESLKQNHRVFLLSNTNCIHLKEINKILFQQTGVIDLNSYFEKAYYSHLTGLRKPNEDIYKYVINDAKIDPASTIFIDDTTINIDAAKRLGFQTHLLLKGESIEDIKYFK